MGGSPHLPCQKAPVTRGLHPKMQRPQPSTHGLPPLGRNRSQCSTAVRGSGASPAAPDTRPGWPQHALERDKASHSAQSHPLPSGRTWPVPPNSILDGVTQRTPLLTSVPPCAGRLQDTVPEAEMLVFTC